MGGTNLFPIMYFSLWQWAEEADATRTNLFNPKFERDLPPATYKHKLTSRVYPKRTIPDWGWVHPTCELMLISCGWEASLPDVGFEQICAGGIGLLDPFPKQTIPDWEKIRCSL